MTLVPYTYRATVLEVHDGDTIKADLDLGLNVWIKGAALRLLGCNARELSEPGGTEARDHLSGILPVGTVVTLHTVKPDKFGGRYDAQVELGDGTDLVALLISTGWAAAWDGTGTKPVPPWPIPA